MILLADTDWGAIAIGSLITMAFAAAGAFIVKVSRGTTKDSITQSKQILQEREALATEYKTHYDYLLNRVESVEAKQDETTKALIHCKENEGIANGKLALTEVQMIATSAKLFVADQKIQDLTKQINELSALVDQFMQEKK